jgi:hypothetical protein
MPHTVGWLYCKCESVDTGVEVRVDAQRIVCGLVHTIRYSPPRTVCELVGRLRPQAATNQASGVACKVVCCSHHYAPCESSEGQRDTLPSQQAGCCHTRCSIQGGPAPRQWCLGVGEPTRRLPLTPLFAQFLQHLDQLELSTVSHAMQQMVGWLVGRCRVAPQQIGWCVPQCDQWV